VVLFGAAFIFLVWKVAVVVTKFGFVDRLEKNIYAIKEDIAAIKGFEKVFRSFMNNLKIDKNEFGGANSPTNLNNLGAEVSEELDIKSMIEKHWDKIHEDLKQIVKDRSNPYDIQQSCMRLTEDFREYLDYAELDKIKRYAFDRGHNISGYDFIFGIELRDKYFRENNINVSDIDKHDPGVKKK